MGINQRNADLRKETNAGKILRKSASFELPTEKSALQLVSWFLSEGIEAEAEEDDSVFTVKASRLTDKEILAAQKHISFMLGLSKATSVADKGIRSTGKVLDSTLNKVVVPVSRTGIKGIFGIGRSLVTAGVRAGASVYSEGKEAFKEAKADLASDPDLKGVFQPSFDSSKVKVEDDD